jgi:hypothetical protein
MAAADNSTDGALTADGRNLHRAAVSQFDHKGDHRRPEREVAPVDILTAAQHALADGQFDEFPSGLHQAANFRSEGGEQKVARERAVEPLELGRGVKHTQLNPLNYAVGEAAYFITRPARDITRVKLMRHNYIRIGSTTSWLEARKQSATSLSGRMSTELRRSSIKSTNCR